MRRPSKNSFQKLSADSQRLAGLAQAMAQAGSRLEERAWERSLDALIQKLLKHAHQDAIDAALDHLFKTELAAYDALMESVEAVSASCTIEQDGNRYDALLVAIPILAWTRFTIASGPIAPEMLTTLSAHLYGHVLAANTRLAIAPTLYAIDQLPRAHVDTFALTQRMAQAALAGSPLRPLVNPPETAAFIADTRFILATVVAPAEAPLFRWQASETPGNVMPEQQNALTQWRTQAMPNIARLLPGCGIELLLPEAYYVACREADKQIRPALIRAAVHYLTHTLGTEPQDLSAIIGGFGEESIDNRVDEYRVSFALRQHPDVVYGIVWPLYGQEDAEAELRGLSTGLLAQAGNSAQTAVHSPRPDYAAPVDEIFSLLRECGITDIKRHDEHFAMEFCDDCGAPLYCDREAELVHAEMPEDAPQVSGHFH
jgi:hypothetical protein